MRKCYCLDDNSEPCSNVATLIIEDQNGLTYACQECLSHLVPAMTDEGFKIVPIRD